MINIVCICFVVQAETPTHPPIYTPKGIYVKEMRKQFGLTQVDLSQKSGVGLRFVRELEQGKETLRLDKVNQVLALFGAVMTPGKISEL